MIKWIVITIISLIILGYLGVDIRKTIDSPVTKSNVEYLKEAIVYVWTRFLATPVKYVWNFFINLIWNTAIDKLNGVKNNISTTTSYISQ